MYRHCYVRPFTYRGPLPSQLLYALTSLSNPVSSALQMRIALFSNLYSYEFCLGKVKSLCYSRVMEKITFDMLESENIYGCHRINTKLTIPYQL